MFEKYLLKRTRIYVSWSIFFITKFQREGRKKILMPRAYYIMELFHRY